MKTCSRCHGSRTIVQVVPNIKRMNGVEYHSHNPAYVERLFVCETCHGSGLEPDPDTISVHGRDLVAPGFTGATIIASIQRAQQARYFHIRPGQHGAVLVDTGTSGAVYVTTRRRCSCPAGRSHGYCKHRAAAIWIADVWGIDLSQEEILGFDPDGYPVTAAERAMQMQEAA